MQELLAPPECSHITDSRILPLHLFSNQIFSSAKFMFKLINCISSIRVVLLPSPSLIMCKGGKFPFFNLLCSEDYPYF